MEPKIERPLRLPVIFGRMIDGILQQLIELILRDYVGVWCSEAGFKSHELIQDLKWVYIHQITGVYNDVKEIWNSRIKLKSK